MAREAPEGGGAVFQEAGGEEQEEDRDHQDEEGIVAERRADMEMKQLMDSTL